ncbi:MAG TPA: TIGR02270 family protein [Gemmataceae bacterium]|nr:TIGR02270 family protein [Gemmataceae bacterium]
MTGFIPKVLSQHVEEAAFNWLIRDIGVRAPHYKLWELSRHDNRLDAHLDGLVIAGDHGWQFALEELDAHPEPGETFAAAYVAFVGGNQARIARILKAAAADRANARAAASALGWLADEQTAADHALQLIHSDVAVARLIGVAAAAIRRLMPGPVLSKALTDKDPNVIARGARAVGEFGATGFAPTLRPMLGSKDLPTRFWAAWSLALAAGDSSAVAELRTVALTEKQFRRRAVDMAVRRGDLRTTKGWLSGLEATAGGRRLVLQALGALGDPDAVPRLLDAMKDPPVARVAGEAFSFITGVHISYDELEAEPPKDFQSGPTEDPADEDVAMDPDGNLYWPDPAKCQKWWAKNQARFAAGTRHLCGRPMTPESLRDVLKNGYQRQRAAAALELAIREPGKPLFEVRAPGFRQHVP